MNKRSLIIISILSIIAISLLGIQKNFNPQELSNIFQYEKFNWTIEIPNQFIKFNSPEFQKTNINSEGIPTQGIFSFDIDAFNVLRAQHEEVPFEMLYDEEEEIIKKGNNIYAQMFKGYPDSLKSKYEIDTSYSTIIIDELSFKKFELKLSNDNIDFESKSYLRQFGDQVLLITSFYINPSFGKSMEHAILNSKFKQTHSPKNILPTIPPKKIVLESKVSHDNYANPDIIDENGIFPFGISLASPQEDVKYLINQNEIVLVDTTAIVLIDYPGTEEQYIEINSNSKKGFSRIDLVTKICKAYHQSFENPKITLINYILTEIYLLKKHNGKTIIELGIDS